MIVEELIGQDVGAVINNHIYFKVHCLLWIKLPERINYVNVITS